MPSGLVALTMPTWILNAGSNDLFKEFNGVHRFFYPLVFLSVFTCKSLVSSGTCLWVAKAKSVSLRIL